jgi:hypothetical protein
MGSAVRVQHDRLVVPKWRVYEMSNVDLLSRRNVVCAEVSGRANIHYSKSWMSILDPLSELQRRYMIVLRLYGASEGANIDPCVRIEVRCSRECSKNSQTKCRNTQSTHSSPDDRIGAHSPAVAPARDRLSSSSATRKPPKAISTTPSATTPYGK